MSSESKLPRDFYNQNTIEVAKQLLGKVLVHHTDKGIMKGLIVETEAYAGIFDKGSHTYGNKNSKRVSIWFNEGGYAYVFQIHGIYYCLGIICENKFTPGAVLIRAIEPLEGYELMKQNRTTSSKNPDVDYKLVDLCNGPSKMCIAMDIDKECNELDLCSDKLFIENGININISEMGFSPRINIDYAEGDALNYWRFFIKNNKYISSNKYEPLNKWRKLGLPSANNPSKVADIFSTQKDEESIIILSNQKNTVMRNKIFELPKVELHIHLEGCISLNTLNFLAKKNKFTLPQHLVNSSSIYFQNFDEFVYTFYAICNVVKEEEDFKYIIQDVISYIKNNNIIYIEVSWTPFLYINRGLNFQKIMDIMNTEIALHNLTNIINFIIDTQKDHGIDVGNFVFNKVLETPNQNIVGIGLTGKEEGFLASEFKNIYQKASEYGLGTTAHAGEYGSSKDIWQCINDLKVKRIGHGIKAISDKILLDYLKEHNIHLEVSPSSNVRLCRTETYFSHPIKEFANLGLNIGVNSDDPTIFGTEISDEYMNLISILNFDLEWIKNSNINAINVAFTSNEIKQKLIFTINQNWKI